MSSVNTLDGDFLPSVENSLQFLNLKIQFWEINLKILEEYNLKYSSVQPFKENTHLEWSILLIASKGPSSQSYGFSSSHVWMWELDYKESWALKDWCFWTVVLEETLASPLDCKEIQPFHPKGDQPWIFIGRTDIEAETPTLLPNDAKNWLIRKGPWC